MEELIINAMKELASVAPHVSIIIELAVIVAGWWYLKEKLKELGAEMSAMKKDFEDHQKVLATHQEETGKTYAKLADVQAVWKEIGTLREGMATGFAGVNAQLTQISAAIIAAVSQK